MEDQSSRACANTDDPNGRSRPIRFSNRPFRVKRFQIHPTVSMSLAGRASLRIGTKAVPEASWHVDGGAIGQRDHGATPGTVIKRRHTSSSRTMASKRRFNQYRQVGKVLDELPDARRELGRPDHAHLSPKLHNVPRRSLTTAMALVCGGGR